MGKKSGRTAYPRKRYDGQVFVVFLALYALGRFLLEFLRADDRGGLLGLSWAQIIGLGVIAGAVALHVRRTRSMKAARAASV